MARRAVRFLLTALSVLSLLLCLAAAGMWARSRWRWDELCWRRGREVVSAESHRGELELRWETDGSEAVGRAWGRGPPGWQLHSGGAVRPGRVLSADCRRRALGFGRDSYDLLHRFVINGVLGWTRVRKVVVPYWFVVLAFVAAPTGYALRFAGRRGRRRRGGLCAECGYNLTGNTSGGCPECGTALKP